MDRKVLNKVLKAFYERGMLNHDELFCLLWSLTQDLGAKTVVYMDMLVVENFIEANYPNSTFKKEYRMTEKGYLRCKALLRKEKFKSLNDKKYY